jgi:hypothetical protein
MLNPAFFPPYVYLYSLPTLYGIPHILYPISFSQSASRDFPQCGF